MTNEKSTMSIPQPTEGLPEEEDEIEIVHFSRSIDGCDQSVRHSTVLQAEKSDSLPSTSLGSGQGVISPVWKSNEKDGKKSLFEKAKTQMNDNLRMKDSTLLKCKSLFTPTHPKFNRDKVRLAQSPCKRCKKVNESNTSGEKCCERNLKSPEHANDRRNSGDSTQRHSSSDYQSLSNQSCSASPIRAEFSVTPNRHHRSREERDKSRESQEWRENKRKHYTREKSPIRRSSHAISYPENNSKVITSSTVEENGGTKAKDGLSHETKQGREDQMEEDELKSSVTNNTLESNKVSKVSKTSYTPFATSGTIAMMNPLQIIQDQIDDLTERNQVLMREGNELREKNERMAKKEEKLTDWMKRKQEEYDQLESKYREAEERIKQFEKKSSKEAQFKTQLIKISDLLEEHRLAYENTKDNTKVN